MIYFSLLAYRRSRRIPPTAIILSSAILILFASTTIYMVTTILFYLSQFLGNLKGADLYTDGGGVVNAVPEYLGNRDSPLHACASTATLTINVRLGPAQPEHINGMSLIITDRSYWATQSCAGERASSGNKITT